MHVMMSLGSNLLCSITFSFIPIEGSKTPPFFNWVSAWENQWLKHGLEKSQKLVGWDPSSTY